jgi:MFS family permease
MTTPTIPASRSPFAEPNRRVGGGWIALFALAWLGIWMAQLTPIQALLPDQVTAVIRNGDWKADVIAFGIISGIAGVCALVAYPVTGALSDRTTSRFGRRRPWILIGVVIFALSLALLSFQTNIVGVGVFWSLAIIGFCVASAAITATISDQVPVNQRGYVSGWISAPQAIGTLLGLAFVLVITSVLMLAENVGYPLVAILLVILALPFIMFVPDQVLRKEQRPRALAGIALISAFWINPVKHPDFGWTLLGRILVNLGNALGTGLLLYFILYALHVPKKDSLDSLFLLVAVYLVFFVIAALVFGRVSDRIGKRKVFVYVAAYLQAFAALLLALVPQYTIALFGAACLGVGYGCYMAVDQALATQVLPDAHSRGKDLGIMNIATAVPQAFGPLFGALIVLWFADVFTTGTGAEAVSSAQSAGFAALYIASGIFAILGGLAMYPIKSVK